MDGPGFVIGIGVELRVGIRKGGQLPFSSPFRWFLHAPPSSKPPTLLKPPISDVWSKGERSGRNIDHGARRRSGRSGSKYDGGIKDDHNWGGPSPKARNKSWPGYALVLSLSHSCLAIAEWARSQSGFGSSPFSLEKCDRWMMLEPQPNSSAGWATHKTVARGPSSRVGHSSYKLNVL